MIISRTIIFCVSVACVAIGGNALAQTPATREQKPVFSTDNERLLKRQELQRTITGADTGFPSEANAWARNREPYLATLASDPENCAALLALAESYTENQFAALAYAEKGLAVPKCKQERRAFLSIAADGLIAQGETVKAVERLTQLENEEHDDRRKDDLIRLKKQLAAQPAP